MLTDPFAEPFHQPVVFWSFVVSVNSSLPKLALRIYASTAPCSLGQGDTSGRTELECLPASRSLLLCLPCSRGRSTPLCCLRDLLAVASISLGACSLRPGRTLTPILWPHCSIFWDGPPHPGLLPGSLLLLPGSRLRLLGTDMLQGFIFP